MKKKRHNSDPQEYANASARRLALNLTQAIKDAPPTLSLREAEILTGISHGTIGGWLHAGDVERLRFVLLKLALLPVGERNAFMERFCPQFPTTNHDLFDPDPLFRDQLLRISEKQTGTTIVCGGGLFWSSFVCSALVNGANEIGKCHVSGIDACVAYDLAPAPIGHRCACLLPIPGVAYISWTTSDADFRRKVDSAWGQISPHRNDAFQNSKAPSARRLLFNGIWRFLAPHRKELASLGRTAHLIIGLESASEDITTELAKPLHVIRISKVPTLKLNTSGGLTLRFSEIEA